MDLSLTSYHVYLSSVKLRSHNHGWCLGYVMDVNRIITGNLYGAAIADLLHAGLQVKRLILHLGHVSYKNASY